MSAEAGAALLCASNVAGQIFVGTATGAPQEVGLEVPVGNHVISCTATDGAGNVSAPYSTNVSYAAPATPRLRQTRKDHSAPLVLAVSGPVGGSATVLLSSGESQPVQFTTSTVATVKFTVPDGEYGVQAVATDRRGTPSGPATLDAVVDTKAPKLVVTVKKSAARDGTLAFRVSAERGADVVVKTKGTRLKADYVAKAKPRSFSKDAGEGKCVVTAVATDAFGNTSTRKAGVKIS